METGNQQTELPIENDIASLAEGVIKESYQISVAETDEGNATPKKDPEIEPEKLPKENPGEADEPDDDDDDDDYEPYTEPEIGDDPDKERVKIPTM